MKYLIGVLFTALVLGACSTMEKVSNHYEKVTQRTNQTNSILRDAGRLGRDVKSAF